MLDQITNINITQDIANLTGFQQAQAISTQPYFLTGLILIFAVIFSLTFFLGFFKVSDNPKSSKVCFQSWIWKAFIAIEITAVLIAIAWFIFPVIFMIGG